jgi:hypothetical protein
LSRDINLEKEIVRRFSTECGSNYVKKIMSMFTDLELDLEIDIEEVKEVSAFKGNLNRLLKLILTLHLKYSLRRSGHLIMKKSIRFLAKLEMLK